MKRGYRLQSSSVVLIVSSDVLRRIPSPGCCLKMSEDLVLLRLKTLYIFLFFLAISKSL